MLRTHSTESAENQPLQPGLEMNKEQSGQTHNVDHLSSDQIKELEASESDGPGPELPLLQDENNTLPPEWETSKDEGGPISIIIDSNHEDEPTPSKVFITFYIHK